MGTNFYTRLNNCDKCGRYDEVHLGKGSAGWQFSFQYNGGFYYKNIDEMKEWLKDKQIFNEYGGEIIYEEFWKLVEKKQKEKLNHADYCKKEYNSKDDFNIGGYSFTDREFS